MAAATQHLLSHDLITRAPKKPKPNPQPKPKPNPDPNPNPLTPNQVDAGMPTTLVVLNPGDREMPSPDAISHKVRVGVRV